MPKWGKPTKNRKRIDPRYFINETTNRDLKEYSIITPVLIVQPEISNFPDI